MTPKRRSVFSLTFIVNCTYKEAFQEGKLSVSQREGIVSLISKGDSDLSELTSWRPITVLSVDCKILAKTIVKRIEPFLPKLID